MILFKMSAGVLLIVFGILSIIKERKDRNKENSFSHLVSESVKFQNYLVSIILTVIGLGLIISCF
jgi:hypothetical protein